MLIDFLHLLVILHIITIIISRYILLSFAIQCLGPGATTFAAETYFLNVRSSSFCISGHSLISGLSPYQNMGRRSGRLVSNLLVCKTTVHTASDGGLDKADSDTVTIVLSAAMTSSPIWICILRSSPLSAGVSAHVANWLLRLIWTEQAIVNSALKRLIYVRAVENMLPVSHNA